MSNRAFSLIELLVVIGIIGVLASVIFPAIGTVREKAKEARTRAELREIATALQLYAEDHGGSYPADVNRGLPNGLEQYIGGGTWPVPSFSGAVYDWDNWTPGNLSYDPKVQTYQISVRFCPSGGEVDECTFPDLPWVGTDWDTNSSAYYCVAGECRSHSSEPTTHPGHCIGGVCPNAI